VPHGSADSPTTHRGEVLERTRRLVAQAIRAALVYDGRFTERIRDDACRQVGVHPSAFRTLFPTDDELLDRVNELLVEEAAGRLLGGIADFAGGTGADGLHAAAERLARARPIDRATVMIRAERRLAALRSWGGPADRVVDAERRFVATQIGVLTEMLDRIGRRFAWRPELAVRVILDTYERSFEAWLIRGHDETDFPSSPYVQRTLPALLAETSTPV
jgi:hypothetical protein